MNNNLSEEYNSFVDSNEKALPFSSHIYFLICNVLKLSERGETENFFFSDRKKVARCQLCFYSSYLYMPSQFLTETNEANCLLMQISFTVPVFLHMFTKTGHILNK